MSDYNKLPYKLLPGCSNRVGAGDCQSTRRSFKLFDYSQEELNNDIVWTHKNCVCNEKCALNYRHQAFDDIVVGDCSPVGDWLINRAQRGDPVPLVKNSKAAVCSHYSSGKWREYLRAQESLLTEPLVKFDAKIRMFLKDDKYHTNRFKPPRCIQYRGKRYGLCLAQYLQPIEKEVYQWLDRYGTPIISKSRNLVQRAGDLRTKWESFVDPVAILIDQSNFDAHCWQQLLRQEHRLYESYYPGDKQLRMLLKWQMDCIGGTRNGTKFRTRGTRYSGDQNTGLGNSVLDVGMLNIALKRSGIKGAIYVDGDDSVIIVERNDVRLLNLSFLEQCGMRAKVEYAYEFEQIEFCQTRPVFDGVAWRMVRNPRRVISRTPWIVKRNHLNVVGRYLKSLGLCELALSAGMPVTQSLALKLIKRGSGKYMVTDLHHQAMREYIQPIHAKARHISDECRESYARAWDISVGEQLELEAGTLVDPMPECETTFEQWGGERPSFGNVVSIQHGSKAC
jgi:hypothetical protein